MPGVLETSARSLRPVSMLMRLDLPTFDRPMTAISGMIGGGHCSGFTLLLMYSAFRTLSSPTLMFSRSRGCAACPSPVESEHSGAECLEMLGYLPGQGLFAGGFGVQHACVTVRRRPQWYSFSRIWRRSCFLDVQRGDDFFLASLQAFQTLLQV